MAIKKIDTNNNLVMRFVLVLVSALLIFDLVVSYAVYKKLLNNNYESVETSIQVTVENLSQTLELIKGTTYAISGSDSIKKWRDDDTYFSGNDKYSSLNRQKLNKELQNVLTYNNTWNFDLYDYITIYENQDLLAITYTKPYSTAAIISATAKIQEGILDEEQYSLMIAPSMDDAAIYTTLRIQTDFNSDDSLYIIGSTNVKGFNEKLRSLVNYDGTRVYIMRNDGVVYASSTGERLGEKLDESIVNQTKKQVDRKIDGANHQVIKWKINNEYSLVYVLPKSAIIRSTFIDMQRILLVSALIAIAVIIFSLTTMVNRLKEVMQKNYESQILLNEMQIKSLQQQMNPHFLFNILLTIQIKAKMSGDEKVYKMISSLSALLRAGIYGDKRTTISIREELKLVEYYLSLQQERYEERLNYQIDVEDDNLLACEIPRLVVEPMVENAIVHGVETMEGDVLINVNLTREADHILITVKDNGVGFDVDELNNPKPVSKDGSIQREKTGINSTSQRIRLMYGAPYGIDIQSKKDEGTTVFIRIPEKRLMREE